RFLRQARKPSTVKRYERSLRFILPALGAVRVHHIDAEGVLRYREERLKAGISPRTVNQDTAVLGAMLNWGVTVGRLIGSNPVKKLKALRHDSLRVRRPFQPPRGQTPVRSEPGALEGHLVRTLNHRGAILGAGRPALRRPRLGRRGDRRAGQRGEEPQKQTHPDGRAAQAKPGR